MFAKFIFSLTPPPLSLSLFLFLRCSFFLSIKYQNTSTQILRELNFRQSKLHSKYCTLLLSSTNFPSRFLQIITAQIYILQFHLHFVSSSYLFHPLSSLISPLLSYLHQPPFTKLSPQLYPKTRIY